MELTRRTLLHKASRLLTFGRSNLGPCLVKVSTFCFQILWTGRNWSEPGFLGFLRWGPKPAIHRIHPEWVQIFHGEALITRARYLVNRRVGDGPRAGDPPQAVRPVKRAFSVSSQYPTSSKAHLPNAASKQSGTPSTTTRGTSKPGWWGLGQGLLWPRSFDAQMAVEF